VGKIIKILTIPLVKMQDTTNVQPMEGGRTWKRALIPITHFIFFGNALELNQLKTLYSA